MSGRVHVQRRGDRLRGVRCRCGCMSRSPVACAPVPPLRYHFPHLQCLIATAACAQEAPAFAVRGGWVLSAGDAADSLALTPHCLCAGKYSSLAGASTCTSCPAGTYSSAAGATSSATCASCPAGTYSSAAGATCAGCPDNVGMCADYVSEDDGSEASCRGVAGCEWNGDSCESAKNGFCGVPPYGQACDPGTDSTDCGTTSGGTCTGMPRFRTAYSPQGSTSSAACGCNQGYTRANGGACSACPAGTYKDTSGTEGCSSCPDNAYSPQGSTSSTTAHPPPPAPAIRVIRAQTAARAPHAPPAPTRTHQERAVARAVRSAPSRRRAAPP